MILRKGKRIGLRTNFRVYLLLVGREKGLSYFIIVVALKIQYQGVTVTNSLAYKRVYSLLTT